MPQEAQPGRRPIATYHATRCKRLGLPGSFKWFRSTSATLLRSARDFADLPDHFLGEAPFKMSDKHYAAPPQQRFNEALEWLGRELGLA